MTEELFSIAAYHESGHVIMAYLSGFSCDSAGIDVSDPAAGKSRMNYGEDLSLVTGLMFCNQDPSIYNNLAPEVKYYSDVVGLRATMTLIGGPAAEAIYKNGGTVDKMMSLEISGPDMDRVDNIHALLSQLKKDHSPNYVSENMSNVFKMLSVPTACGAVDALAKKMLQSNGKQLTKVEIETVLKEVGYLDFIAAL